MKCKLKGGSIVMSNVIKIKNTISVFCLLFIMIFVFAGNGLASDDPKFGGTLRVAIVGHPPTLDVHINTGFMAGTIGMNIFEGLYTFNSNYEPVPFLVKESETKDEGKHIILHLREGVLFHNGKELTSEDVVASLNRWGKHGPKGQMLFNYIDRVEASDKYTVNMYFKEIFSPWKNLFAFFDGPVIYPKEVMDVTGAEPVKVDNYIGTGPFEFVEWQEGRQIVLKRFENYVAKESEPDGWDGNRVAYFDEIHFFPVEDSGTRFNGVKAGDYDYAMQIESDFYADALDDPDILPILNEGAKSQFMFFNSKSGIMKDNYELRRAIQACLEMDKALSVGFGGPDGLWKLNGAIYPPGTFWYANGGLEHYNQANVEKAKELAVKAGYNGETIRFMTTTSYAGHYESCVVLAQQLEDAGFNIDLQMYDWATLTSRRADPELWDIFHTRHGMVPDPILYTFLSDDYPGWWVTERRLELTSQLVKTIEAEERHKIWDDIQSLLYEEVPVIKIGDTYEFNIASPRMKGIGELSMIFIQFWGQWFGDN